MVESIKSDTLLASIKLLQVSVLTNLCFDNDAMTACLLRFTKSKDLLSAIKDNLVFWCKMAIALTRFDGIVIESEMLRYLKMIFDAEYFVGLIRNNDQRVLHNIMDLLVIGSERDEHSKQIMEQFDFTECIEGVLTVSENCFCFNTSSSSSLHSFFAVNLQLGN